ncbi:MAG: beta-galactosidase trimerization domain-containing protein, partial [Anaerolineae bacterium]|nr:beta-galactosidase trimerization domain-containing protein [Anaerolineae bacterium]
RYEEVQQLGEELKVVGPEILGTSVRVDVGIAAADVDVYDAHSALSLGLPSPRHVAEVVHTTFVKNGYAVGCVHPSDDLSDLKVYVIPHWAIFKPEWMPALEAWVEDGGTLIVGARTATKDWNNNVVAETPPGLFHKLCGIKVLEYGRRNDPDKRPLIISFPKERVGADDWYEVLEIMPGAGTLARWDSRHIKRKPAITMKKVGEGAVIYVGATLSRPIIQALLPALEERGLEKLWAPAPDGVQVVVRENAEKRLWFFFNATDMLRSVLQLPANENLLSLTGSKFTRLYMQPHDVAILKEIL